MDIRATNILILIVLLLNLNIYLSCALSNDGAAALCGSGDWLVYSDTKCLKLVDTTLTYDEALTACDLAAAGREPQPILTINSLEEQNAVTALLFDQLGVVENVWLGAIRSPNPSVGFVWRDESPLEFTNWAPGSPSNDLQKNCSQLTSELSRGNGDWRDVSCSTQNLAICQKEQQWSPAQLRATILQQRKETRDALLKLRQAHDSLQIEYNAFKANPVPIGFMYTEYPGHPTPSSIWPGVTWTEITSSFAGLFFRAAGGQSAGFGETQEDATRQITEMGFTYRQGYWSYANPLSIPKSGWSDFGESGFDDTGDHGTYYEQGIRFHTLNTEVRPRNTAIKIWRRTA